MVQTTMMAEKMKMMRDPLRGRVGPFFAKGLKLVNHRLTYLPLTFKNTSEQGYGNCFILSCIIMVRHS